MKFNLILPIIVLYWTVNAVRERYDKPAKMKESALKILLRHAEAHEQEDVAKGVKRSLRWMRVVRVLLTAALWVERVLYAVIVITGAVVVGLLVMGTYVVFGKPIGG